MSTEDLAMPPFPSPVARIREEVSREVPELMDTATLATRCGVVPETVREWVRAGWLRPWGRTRGGHMRWTEAHVALAIRGRPSEVALDYEAHVVSARARLRGMRGSA